MARKKLEFRKTDSEGIRKEIFNKEHPEKTIFNFLNGHNVWLFKHHRDFKRRVEKKHNLNHVDGFVTSSVLSFMSFKPITRLKGPDFTHFILSREEFADRKHLFIGMNKKDIENTLKKYPHLKRKNCLHYDLPKIDEKNFDDRELVKYINKQKPDYIWVGLGSPKQEIISNDLREKIKQGYIFNVGAAFDYIRGKKKQAPKPFQKLGLEWFYRFVVDFHHSKKKVARSLFAGVFYTPLVTGLRK